MEEYALLANLKSHARRVAEAERALAGLLEANREAFSCLLEGLALRLRELARDVAPEIVFLARLAADCLLVDVARKMALAVGDLAAYGAASLDLALKRARPSSRR